MAQEEFPQHYPDSGWVEHDPGDLWATTAGTCRHLSEAERSERMAAGEPYALRLNMERWRWLITSGPAPPMRLATMPRRPVTTAGQTHRLTVMGPARVRSWCSASLRYSSTSGLEEAKR